MINKELIINLLKSLLIILILLILVAAIYIGYQKMPISTTTFNQSGKITSQTKSFFNVKLNPQKQYFTKTVVNENKFEILSEGAYELIVKSNENIELIILNGIITNKEKLVINSRYTNFTLTEEERNFKMQNIFLEPDSTLYINTLENYIVFIEGEFKITLISDQTEEIQIKTLLPYDKIAFNNENKNIQINKIDRKTLANSLTILNNQYFKELLPINLQDFTPPEIIELNKSTEDNTKESKVKISLKCKDCISLFINNNSEILTQKDEEDIKAFEKEFDLQIGEKKFIIEIADEFQNKNVNEFKIVRIDPCAGNNNCGECGNPACPVYNNPGYNYSATPSQSGGICTHTGFNSYFQCLLNQYRTQSGLNALSFENALNNAACSHTSWMANTGNFSHTGEGGSTPWQRCNNAGTSCDAENIAYASYGDASVTFNQWKNSAGHNANMLGSHTVLGVCNVNGYSTLVLR